MKYVVFILFLILFSSCKTKENTYKKTSISEIKGSQTSISATNTDSIIRAITARIISEMKEIIFVTDYYENAPGDSVRRIKKETKIQRDFSQTTLTADSSKRYTRSVIEVTSSDTTKTNTQASEDTNKSSDGRLIQGGEWLWVILGFGIILIIVVLLLILRIGK